MPHLNPSRPRYDVIVIPATIILHEFFGKYSIEERVKCNHHNKVQILGIYKYNEVELKTYTYLLSILLLF